MHHCYTGLIQQAAASATSTTAMYNIHFSTETSKIYTSAAARGTQIERITRERSTAAADAEADSTRSRCTSRSAVAAAACNLTKTNCTSAEHRQNAKYHFLVVVTVTVPRAQGRLARSGP